MLKNNLKTLVALSVSTFLSLPVIAHDSDKKEKRRKGPPPEALATTAVTTTASAAKNLMLTIN